MTTSNNQTVIRDLSKLVKEIGIAKNIVNMAKEFEHNKNDKKIFIYHSKIDYMLGIGCPPLDNINDIFSRVGKKIESKKNIIIDRALNELIFEEEYEGFENVKDDVLNELLNNDIKQVALIYYAEYNEKKGGYEFTYEIISVQKIIEDFDSYSGDQLAENQYRENIGVLLSSNTLLAYNPNVSFGDFLVFDY